jgi:hypothetical protein
MGEGEGEGEGEAGGVIDYCDNWLMDELSQDNPYFDCQQCHLWRDTAVCQACRGR